MSGTPAKQCTVQGGGVRPGHRNGGKAKRDLLAAGQAAQRVFKSGVQRIGCATVWWDADKGMVQVRLYPAETSQ